MRSSSVIQKLLRVSDGTTYLEIGVKTGATFFRVRVKRKIGVDPEFRIPFKTKIRHLADFVQSRRYALTSDEFFRRAAPALFAGRKIDVAFVDGLHHWEQALRDIENCFRYLSEDGCIVVDDCNPPAEELAVREYAGDGPWCGDVWKAIVSLRSSRNDMRIFVLDFRCGTAVITKGASEKMLGFSRDAVDRMQYRDLERARAGLLNLKPSEYLAEFIDSYRKRRETDALRDSF